MKGKKLLLLLAVAVGLSLSTFSAVAEAHPGRTDANGGHYCRTNCEKWGLSYGEYHYHNGGGSTSSTSTSANALTQQAEAQKQAEAQRLAEAKRQADEQQRIAQEKAQNEDSQKQGSDAGYQTGLDDGYKQFAYSDIPTETNTYYRTGYKEGYQRGYNEGKAKYEAEQARKEELINIQKNGETDGGVAFKDGKKISEYGSDYPSYTDDEQKQNYVKGFEKGWNDAKKAKELKIQQEKEKETEDAKKKLEEERAKQNNQVVGGVVTASVPTAGIAYWLWRKRKKKNN